MMLHILQFLKPDAIYTEITHINPKMLKALGVKGIIFDLDNTIVPPHTNELQPRIARWLQAIKEAGFPFVVVSNNHNVEYMKRSEHVLGIPVIGPAKKPSTKAMKQAFEWLKLPPEEVVMIGDRPLTDIWAGQRAGCKTILVDSLMRANEHGLIHLLRTLERLPVQVPPGTRERLYKY
jgi:uncharacterized protein